MTALEKGAPRIPEFYKGRSIFITGFTGFMGKILVEKLLWSCPDIERIYVLLRDKKGQSPQQRLQSIIQSDVFSRVRDLHKGNIYKKIIPLNGDVTLPGLGITPEERTIVCDEVSIIFHCAASVRFDDPLTTAIDINVQGTKSTIDLALEMPKIVAFLHVSTAYSNCDKFDIEEKVYSSIVNWSETLKIRDKIDPSIFNTMCAKYSNHMPNTYVFAKSLGEHIVNDHADRLPVSIFRPSIVINTLTEPFPGWLDNFNGPTGLLLGYGTGVVRTSLNDNNIMPDFIPVDIAIRGLIVSAYTRIYKRVEGAHIYNWCARDRSVTYKELIEYGKRLVDEAPLKYLIWSPTTHTTNNKLVFYINFLLFQVIPAFFIDIFLRAIGKSPIMIKIQRRFFIAMSALSYFTLNYFNFHNKNGYDLADYIPPEDFHDFNYVIKQEEMDLYKFFYDSNKYFQSSFMKMTPEDDRKAKILLMVLRLADGIVKTSFFLYLSWLIYKHNIIPDFLSSAITFFSNF